MWIFGENDFECCSCTVLYIFYTIKEKYLLDFYMILQSFSLYCGCFIPLALVYLFILFFFFFSGEETLK